MSDLSLADIKILAQTVVGITPRGEVQLSILCRTYIAACKTLGISRGNAIREIQRAWDDQQTLDGRAG